MRAIAAATQKHIIGNGDKIPWHYPDDLKWFKKTTKGGILVMGRLTYVSMFCNNNPVKLGERKVIVLTSKEEDIHIHESDSGLVCFTNSYVPFYPTIVKGYKDKRVPPEFVTNRDNYWLCGGSEVYKQLLNYCTDFYLTQIKKDFEGDKYLPPFEHQFTLAEKIKSTKDFDILHYSNVYKY